MRHRPSLAGISVLACPFERTGPGCCPLWYPGPLPPGSPQEFASCYREPVGSDGNITSAPVLVMEMSEISRLWAHGCKAGKIMLPQQGLRRLLHGVQISSSSTTVRTAGQKRRGRRCSRCDSNRLFGIQPGMETGALPPRQEYMPMSSGRYRRSWRRISQGMGFVEQATCPWRGPQHRCGRCRRFLWVLPKIRLKGLLQLPLNGIFPPR